MAQIHSFADYLPDGIVTLIRSRISAEFATVSQSGVPIDTPTFFFPDAALRSLDIGTGVAYPAKAERARRNPKVGMLIEGGPDEPVVSIAGYAAVQDADIQANLERYLAETIFTPNVDPDVVDWEVTRKRLYYLSRIIVAVTPAHVRWWPSRAAMDGAPNEWRAEAGTPFPPSDPLPEGRASASPEWPQRNWRELADEAVAGGMPAHLTLLDDAGFPLPIRARSLQQTPTGFELELPNAAPWHQGKATLSFVGKEIFVGEAAKSGDVFLLHVDRALPVLPMMADRTGMTPDVLAKLDDRLAREMVRRGQQLPVVPATPPLPTQGALLRAAGSKAIDARSVGAGIAR